MSLLHRAEHDALVAKVASLEGELLELRKQRSMIPDLVVLRSELRSLRDREEANTSAINILRETVLTQEARLAAARSELIEARTTATLQEATIAELRAAIEAMNGGAPVLVDPVASDRPIELYATPRTD